MVGGNFGSCCTIHLRDKWILDALKASSVLFILQHSICASDSGKLMNSFAYSLGYTPSPGGHFSLLFSDTLEKWKHVL